MDLLVVGEHEEGRGRGGDGGYGHPGQDQGDGGHGAPDAGQGVGQGDRGQGAPEGGQGHQAHGTDSVVQRRDDDRGRSQAGPGRHADEVGVGQGVAEDGLVGGAGEGQGGPHQARYDHPRQADLPHDVLPALGQAVGQAQTGWPREDDAGHGVGGDGDGSDGCGQHDRAQQGAQAQEEPGPERSPQHAPEDGLWQRLGFGCGAE